MALQVVNIQNWIEKNQEYFVPPVCNKLLHNEQLKMMYIGGPNIREDYHIEEGEEFFYMVKGDMCLKVIEKGVQRDIVIKEGEAFLLPCHIPHSPQRNENTIGLVIERKRSQNENDVLRYFVGDGSNDVLFEKAFHCENLGTQLAPIINEFFNSDVYKTRVPDKKFILDDLPFKLDETTTLDDPVPLLEKLMLDDNAYSGSLFPGKHQFDIKVYSSGQSELETGSVEHWLWQVIGTSTVTVGGQVLKLKGNESVLVPPKTRYGWTREDQSKALRILQNTSEE